MWRRCLVGAGARRTGAGTDTAALPPGGADSAPIIFALSGGRGGRNELLVVEPDGTAVLTSGTGGEELGTRELSAADVAELRRLLDGSGLFTENRSFEGEITDDIYYEITYRGATVSAASSAAPEELLPAASRLTDLLNSIGE